MYSKIDNFRHSLQPDFMGKNSSSRVVNADCVLFLGLVQADDAEELRVSREDWLKCFLGFAIASTPLPLIKYEKIAVLDSFST